VNPSVLYVILVECTLLLVLYKFGHVLWYLSGIELEQTKHVLGVFFV
jgi:hypothetical protein